jgi:hypothetical protein
MGKRQKIDERQTSNVKRQTSNVKRQTSNVKRQTLKQVGVPRLTFAFVRERINEASRDVTTQQGALHLNEE